MGTAIKGGAMQTTPLTATIILIATMQKYRGERWNGWG